MRPRDLHEVLKGIGADCLYHANTVTTSCAFLENAALLSRAFVENNRLRQTPQASDDVDKKFGIWDRIFVDHVDIHFRGGRVKGANQYGPVLFVLPIDVLLQLPPEADVAVTKQNPVHWFDKQSDGDRWYGTPAELGKSISRGDFDKMIVIKVESGKMDFPGRAARVLLDDPQRTLKSGKAAYDHALELLHNAAAVGNVGLTASKHECRPDCACVRKYSQYTSDYFEMRFNRI